MSYLTTQPLPTFSSAGHIAVRPGSQIADCNNEWGSRLKMGEDRTSAFVCHKHSRLRWFVGHTKKHRWDNRDGKESKFIKSDRLWVANIIILVKVITVSFFPSPPPTISWCLLNSVSVYIYMAELWNYTHTHTAELCCESVLRTTFQLCLFILWLKYLLMFAVYLSTSIWFTGDTVSFTYDTWVPCKLVLFFPHPKDWKFMSPQNSYVET